MRFNRLTRPNNQRLCSLRRRRRRATRLVRRFNLISVKISQFRHKQLWPRHRSPRNPQRVLAPRWLGIKHRPTRSRVLLRKSPPIAPSQPPPLLAGRRRPSSGRYRIQEGFRTPRHPPLDNFRPSRLLRSKPRTLVQRYRIRSRLKSPKESQPRWVRTRRRVNPLRLCPLRLNQASLQVVEFEPGNGWRMAKCSSTSPPDPALIWS